MLQQKKAVADHVWKEHRPVAWNNVTIVDQDWRRIEMSVKKIIIGTLV